MKVLAFDKDGIHRFAASEVDVECWLSVAGFDKRGHIAINNLACVRYTGQGNGNTIVESFRFCEQIHLLYFL